MSKAKIKIPNKTNLSILAIILVLILGLVITLFITSRNSKTSEPHPSVATQIELTEVTIITQTGEVTVYAELAQTNYERQQGLMYRTELEENHGMLFIFPKEQMLSFWMKNTLIPLDIIFIDKDKTIINIAQNTKTNQTSEVYPSKREGLYVLEVNGGWCSTNRVEAGDKVKFNIGNSS